jgi:hypothetical protein
MQHESPPGASSERDARVRAPPPEDGGSAGHGGAGKLALRRVMGPEPNARVSAPPVTRSQQEIFESQYAPEEEVLDGAPAMPES